MAQLKAIELSTNADESAEDEPDQEVDTPNGKEVDPSDDDVEDAPMVHATGPRPTPAQRLRAFLESKPSRKPQVKTDPKSSLTNGETSTDKETSNPCVLPDYVAWICFIFYLPTFLK